MKSVGGRFHERSFSNLRLQRHPPTSERSPREPSALEVVGTILASRDSFESIRVLFRIWGEKGLESLWTISRASKRAVQRLLRTRVFPNRRRRKDERPRDIHIYLSRVKNETHIDSASDSHSTAAPRVV